MVERIDHSRVAYDIAGASQGSLGSLFKLSRETVAAAGEDSGKPMTIASGTISYILSNVYTWFGKELVKNQSQQVVTTGLSKFLMTLMSQNYAVRIATYLANPTVAKFVTAGVWAFGTAFVFFTTKSLAKSLQWMRRSSRLHTKPQRDKRGKLLFTKKDFPFAQILYDTIKSGGSLSETFVDAVFDKRTSQNSNQKESDRLDFKFFFVPIEDREERFTEKHKLKYESLVNALGITEKAKVNLVLRRASEYDVLHQKEIVFEALRIPGTTRTPEWGKRYMKMRGFT
jgi:hypothetical protein